MNAYKLHGELQNGMVDNEGSTCYNTYVNLLSDSDEEDAVDDDLQQALHASFATAADETRNV